MGAGRLERSAENDSPSLIVYSEDDDALKLCDIPQESVEYVPPQRERSPVRLGDSTFLLRLTYDNRTHDEMSGEIEGSDLTIETRVGTLPKAIFLWHGNIRRTPVYVKGEYGSLEDCGFFDDLNTSDYLSDDFDGFDGPDTFHPDRVQSCWIEIDYERCRWLSTNVI